MQAVIDSTALMLAKEVSSLNSSEITKKAQSYFNAMYNRSETANVQVTPTYNSTTGQLTVTAVGVLKTTFTKVLGISQMNISTMTQVVVGGSKLEIALVLDNTGSMESSGKLEALIAASKMFVNQMQKASKKPGDIKISIVPFDTHVNIGTAYKDVAWIDWSLMDESSGDGWGSGGWSRNGSDKWGSGPKNNWGDGDSDTRMDWDRTGGKVAWNGCVIDRSQPYDANDTAPTGNAATWYPAENCALAPVLPLTSDWSSAKSTLDDMKASGKTNLTIGLVWGWHVLSPGAPFTEGTPSSPAVEKYIVFLTDGMNTQNRWSTSAAEIDARTKAVCGNIKAAGIKVYTVRIKEGNEALLRGCATGPNMYYDVPAVSQIMSVFNSIAKDITRLRIAR
jgi:Mg-chelatase subunit ChlD